ncbi:MAG: L,D-transpeptidase family protein [Methyloceanibacter sp.]|nr:L,D-transpeptidase family protein [Methyloceanibacter sp.]
MEARVRAKRPLPIVVRRAPGRPKEARVQLAHGVRRAALGRGGLKVLKREGDGATPIGSLPVRGVLYRADRLARPRTALPLRAIGPRDGWCDDPADRNYNRLVRLPYGRSAETMMRGDALYDLVLVLGYNDRTRVRGRGSAIFAHLARPGYTPTDGCIAFSREDMAAVLAQVRKGSAFLVIP